MQIAFLELELCSCLCTVKQFLMCLFDLHLDKTLKTDFVSFKDAAKSKLFQNFVP